MDITKIWILATVLLLGVTIGKAQYDPKAKEILDVLSEKTRSYQTIKLKFVYEIQNQKENKTEQHEGTMYLKGKKYKLFFMKTEVFFDGKYLTSFAVEQKEATISTPDNESEEINNPAQLLTIHEKGFKYRYAGDLTIEGVENQLIELVPEKREGKKYSKIKLWINKKENRIESIKVLGKNGVNYQVNIIEYKPDVTINDKLFVFDAEAHPDVEVIDIREE